MIYHTPLHLLLAAILDAILDFSAHTNNGHCILADSYTSGYDKHFVYNIQCSTLVTTYSMKKQLFWP